MTCIVGIVSDGVVHLGGDSAGVGGNSLTTMADPKVFRRGEFVIGFTSSFRMGQLLAHGFKPPKPRVGADVMTFMVTAFVDAVRKLMKTGGCARISDRAELGGTFLVGFAGRLFHIYDDFQVAESVRGFDACGCGAAIALGSLHATRRYLDVNLRLREALEASEAFSPGVRGPFHFVSTKGMDE